MDLNENDSCNAGEPTAVTVDGGRYNLDIPADARYRPIVADIPAEAIDEDTGEAVGQSLVFIAPADKPEFLSPITTLVNQELLVNPALDVEDAERAVKSVLGIADEDVSLFSDYVAAGRAVGGNSENVERFRYLHDAARVVASMMKDIETQVTSAAVSNGVDVVGSMDTQRAIREIVRSDVRELLPEIARQLAQFVDTDDTSGQDGDEVEAEFNPNQLAQILRPSDPGESVQERIEAIRDRVDIVQSDIRQVLTDGVYWMELDCNHDFETEVSIAVEGETSADDYDDYVTATAGDFDDIDFASPECEARIGQVRLNDSQDSLVSDNYMYDGELGAWVVEVAGGDLNMADYSLVDGQWVLVQSDGPAGEVEFTEDGIAVISNDAGQMQLKTVTQEIGATKVVGHFWQDGADPIWLGLVDQSEMFSAGSLAHKISVRQSLHPYMLFNRQAQDDQVQDSCTQFNGNCNVINSLKDGQYSSVTSLEEVRDSAAMSMDLEMNSVSFGNALIKLSAEVSLDGTLPASGSVHWNMGMDGNDYGSNEISVVGIETGVDDIDAYSAYFAGQDVLLECSENSNSEVGYFPATYESFPAGIDDSGTGVSSVGSVDSSKPLTSVELPDEAGQYPVVADSENHEGSGLPGKAACADLMAQTGSVSVTGEYTDVFSTDAEHNPESVGENARMLTSSWNLIEIDGEGMIEIQIPFVLRHESDAEGGEAFLLIEHDGYVRLGTRSPEFSSERVLTYNQAAFTTLRAIVESGFAGH